MQASLIIAVYNQARQLELILDSIKIQTCKDIEIVIADDGSSDNTLAVIDGFRQSNPDIPVLHVFQEDDGFRKTMILNKAINKATSNYLIFIDGDMILEKHFIEYHFRYQNSQHVLCGHRGVKLSPQYTEALLKGDVIFNSSLLSLIKERVRGNLDHPFRNLILHNSLLRKLLVSHRTNLSGCNFSLYREAIEKVNGFNEDILEHGYNDYELGHRLKLAGYKLVDVSKLCNTFHMYHKSRKHDVRESLERVNNSTEFRCSNGLQKIHA